MNKKFLEDIKKLAGLNQINENYIYASEDEPEDKSDDKEDTQDTAPDQVPFEKKDTSDGEYDDEEGMAKDQLTSIEQAAKELEELLQSNEDLPEWIQAKITKAQDYLDTAKDVLKSRHDQGNIKKIGEATKKKPDADGDGIPDWADKNPNKKSKDEEDRKVDEEILKMQSIAGIR